METLSYRFWVEAAAAGFSGFLSALTIVVPDWIEAVFRVDPDRHNGSLEWLIVVVLVAATVVFGLLARQERQRRALQH